MNYSCIENEYLIDLLRSALMSKPVNKAPEGISWSDFTVIAEKQQVYSIIANALQQLDIPQKQAEELDVYNKNELLRILAMKNELEEIKLELENEHIEFMLVKGSVIKNYYPKQKMRQMTDVDILYKPEHQEKLISLMKRRGYLLKTAAANSDDFFKKPFYTFEFHRNIFDENDSFHPDFDPWRRAERTGDGFEYSISNEDIFVYSLCHMYDHYCVSGCGVRFLCDICVLLNSIDELDWSYIKSTFEEFGFADFCNTAIGLTKTLFMDGEEDESQQKLLDYMLSGGVYGVSKSLNDVIKENYGGSKLRYILYRLFPPKEYMLGNFPKLREKPYLYPLFYIVRLFQKLKFNFKDIKKEINKLK